MSKTKIHVLQAEHGDSFVIQTYDKNKRKFTILVDGGPPSSFKMLVRELIKYPKIDLIVLTHIDEDHIGGLLTYFKSDSIRKHKLNMIMLNAPNLLKINNSTQISTGQGTDFEKVIHSQYSQLKLITEVFIEKDSKISLPKGIEITILSPNKKALDFFKHKYPSIDLSTLPKNTQTSNSKIKLGKYYDLSFSSLMKKSYKKTIKNDFINASSIAFSLKTKDFHGLFLGDAHPDIVIEGLKRHYNNIFPIQFDCVKISHHGSKYNTSNELLDYIQAHNYIISTNGGRGTAKHPDRATIAKITQHRNMQKSKVNFYLNYPLKEMEAHTGKLFNMQESNTFNLIHKNPLVI